MTTTLTTPLLGQIIADPASHAAGSTATLTWTHNIGAGSNRVLIVGVSVRRANRAVSSVTYAGTPLSRVGFQNSASNTARIELWSLLNPSPVGPPDVIVTLSGSADVVGGAASFSGVDQTNPLGTFTSAGGTGLYGSLSVSSATHELIVDVVATPGTGLSLTPDGGQAIQWNDGTGNAGNNVHGAASSLAGASSVSTGWTLGASTDWVIGAISLKPVPYPNIVLDLSQDNTNPPPGNSVVYTINYVNNGVGPAGSTLLALSPPLNTTLVPNSVVLNGVPKTDAADSDEVTLTGATITVNLGSVPSGSGGTVKYQVVIQ